VIAVSGDSVDTARRFRDSLKAPYSFVSDEAGVLMRAFDVKLPLLTLARRVTFVIGAGRKVLAIQEGSDAMDPSGAVSACSLEKPKALQFLTPKDGG
jgi:peroxiredoxin Q/BCP